MLGNVIRESKYRVSQDERNKGWFRLCPKIKELDVDCPVFAEDLAVFSIIIDSTIKNKRLTEITEKIRLQMSIENKTADKT